MPNITLCGECNRAARPGEFLCDVCAEREPSRRDLLVRHFVDGYRESERMFGPLPDGHVYLQIFDRGQADSGDDREYVSARIRDALLPDTIDVEWGRRGEGWAMVVSKLPTSLDKLREAIDAAGCGEASNRLALDAQMES